MKQLLVVTKPGRAVGFLLAGVTTYEATGADSARQVIEQWVERGERGLLAIDSELVAGLEASFMNWLEEMEEVDIIEIPAPGKLDPEVQRQQYLESLRETIGFRITFGEDQAEISP